MWHRSLWSLVALCGVLLVASFHEHGVQAVHAQTVPTAAASSAPSAAPECRSSDLRADYRPRSAAAGHRYGVIRLRNVGPRACVVQGYGGLSYVGGGDGAEIGAPADRLPGTTARRVVLAPGDRAVSTVAETVAENYPRRACRPVEVDGFRVYAPDATRSFFVQHATTGCLDDSVHLREHGPYRG